MLREYEFTFITSPIISDEETRSLVAKYEGILLQDGGAVVKKSDWGLKKLAFPIKKQFKGRYHFYDLTAKPENLKETERLMRIDDGILRYLSIKIGENVNVEERKNQLAKHEAEMAARAALREERMRHEDDLDTDNDE